MKVTTENLENYIENYIEEAKDFAPTLFNNIEEQQSNPEKFYCTLSEAVYNGAIQEFKGLDEIWEKINGDNLCYKIAKKIQRG